MITVTNLTKYYADNLALDNVSFEVKGGDIVGFLGPNGAGKSTTMKIITCFLPPSGGNAVVAGYDILTKPMDVRRHIGYMPENVPLYTEMRVKEYLHFRAKIKDVPRKERLCRVEKVMERCWLTTVQRQTIGTLSKGYRQRVGLADAMVADPDILILDEPTIGLDPNQVRQVRTLIKEVGQDHTVLISTHILPEVEMICDRVIIINGGRIAMQASLEDLRRESGLQAEYYVELSGPAEKALAVLRAVPGAHEVREHAPHHTSPDASAFVMRLGGGTGGGTGGEAIAGAVAAAGLGLREMRRRERTLEDVFVEVVAREQVPA